MSKKIIISSLIVIIILLSLAFLYSRQEVQVPYNTFEVTTPSPDVLQTPAYPYSDGVDAKG